MIAWVLGAGALLVLVFALLSPLESLRWWSRRTDAPLLNTLVHPASEERENPGPAPQRYVIYLSGIGSVDARTDSRRERAVLDAISERVPGVVVAADVFPYAVENRGLSERATTWFWSRLQRWQRVPVASLISNLINLRNALRVLVSADPRYGPTYNLAVAQEIGASLDRHGYRWPERTPVTIIGYSGGGQIALGASWYLAGAGVPVSVISLGGVLSDDPALDRIEHLWHLYGAKDLLQHLGAVLFPGRWPTARLSTWHAAHRAGRITRRRIGPMRHTGGRDYFDRHITDTDGTSYRDLTITALQEILTGAPPAVAEPSS
ncbi:MAG TPA: hypothetical protein VK095_15430 [Beutenbergiaceae bacterium]|nr:hypothetical protein [Beutenbergiaceae bacterium]